ncbi:MAG: hypothetical protein JNJ54_36180 [Myxococcaceae bacterium]|nr:hypothetical protein [Myxococcaceae bacterium]
MTFLAVLSLLAGVPLPQECEPPPLHDVAPLKTFAQKSGTLSVGLDSVATWCFDSGGAWTGGQRPEPGKKPKPIDPKAPPVGDCARALTSCDDAKAALTDELMQALLDALGDLERPWRGQKYPPRRTGLNERPPTTVNCKERSRPDLFSQAQARMDLARLASTVQNEYANYKTWLFARGLECAQQVKSGRVDTTRVAISVDAPVGPGTAGGAAGKGIAGGTAVVATSAGTGTTTAPSGTSTGTAAPATVPGSASAAGATGSTGASGGTSGVGSATGTSGTTVGATGTGTRGTTAGSTGSTGGPGGTSGIAGTAGTTATGTTVGTTGSTGKPGGVSDTPAATGSIATPGGTSGAAGTAGSTGTGATAGATGSTGAPVGTTGTTVGATGTTGTAGATGSTGPGGSAKSGLSTAANPSGTPDIGAAPVVPPPVVTTTSGSLGAAGATSPATPAEAAQPPANPLLETWRSLASQRARLELDRDYTLGFLASRELRDCRCQRSSPAGIVTRLESGEGTAQLEADNQRAVACEHCLQNAFAAWRGRVQKQCALMGELSEYELEVLQRSDDGNGIPPRCWQDIVAKKGLDAGVFLATPAITARPPPVQTTMTVPLPVADAGTKTLVSAGPVQPLTPPPTGMPRFEPTSTLADGFFRPNEPAPIPLREDGRLYVRVFMSSTCAADVLPGPVLARTGDLLLIPYGAKQLSLRSPCGGLAEVYWGREPTPRVSEVFGRNQPLHLQFRPQ